MKLRDYVYDKDLKKANIMLDEVEPVQLENLLLILREEEEEVTPQENWDEIIYGSN